MILSRVSPSLRPPNLSLAEILNRLNTLHKLIKNHFCTVLQRLAKYWHQESLWWSRTPKPNSSRCMRGCLTTALAKSTVTKRGTSRIKVSEATSRRYIPITTNARQSQYWSMKMDLSSSRIFSPQKSLLRPNNKEGIMFKEWVPLLNVVSEIVVFKRTF